MTHAQAVQTDAVGRYLLDEMPDNEKNAFEDHYFDCHDCAEDLRAGGRMREGVQAGLLDVSEPPIRRPHNVVALHPRRTWSPSVVVPWAAAAMLALTVGYQTMWVVPGLREELTTRALSPVTLRAASRGAAAVVARPSAGPMTFALEVPGVSAGAGLTYDLRAADGESVASGAATAPPPGAPLLLLVPGSSLASSGSYVLSIRTGEAQGPATAEYRFTVTE